MKVVALRSIGAGEEVHVAFYFFLSPGGSQYYVSFQILTSYIDTTVSRERRREELEMTYGFTCKCSVCEMPEGSVDPRECVRCPRAGCVGLVPHPREGRFTIYLSSSAGC